MKFPPKSITAQRSERRQLLFQLRSTEVEVEMSRIQGDRLAANEQLLSVRREEANPSGLKREERIRLAGQAGGIEANAGNR